MKRGIGAALGLVALTGLAAGSARASEGQTGYAPMKPFELYAGQVWRGVGAGPDKAVDIAEWEFILGGRALQVTHSIGEGAYGGRTIYFFDEGSKRYVFHYFTTDGFHSTGEVVLTEDGLEAIEHIIGHPTITETRGLMKRTKDGFEVSSKYLSKGEWVEGHGFTYSPHDGGAPSFKNTSASYTEKAD